MQPQSSEPHFLQYSNFIHGQNNTEEMSEIRKEKSQQMQLATSQMQLATSQNNKQKQQPIHRAQHIKTQQSAMNQNYTKNSLHKKSNKSPQTKFHATTYRSGLMKSIHNSNQLILVYLMYKQQKLSLFLSKGVPFEFLIKKMYKEIYIYEKQTYSISNAILKNLLYKITGFQSIDNDIVYDYELKYKRGTLTKQKFFIPFKQQDHKTPFKMYTRISTNMYGGNQFLARNYSDGEWVIITTIKKNTLDEDKISVIKKSLKSNSIGCSLLMKSCSSSFSQINWLQTKHNLIVVSQYFCQTLEQNLKKNHSNYTEQQSQQIFIYYAKWLAYSFKQMVLSNVHNFKKLSLKNIGLNPSDGQPKISILDNVVNCIDFTERRKSVITNGKRVSEKIQDIYYYETYLSLIKSLQAYLCKENQFNQLVKEFIHFVQEKTVVNFTFDAVFRYFSSNDSTSSSTCFQKQKEKHPLQVDFTSKLTKIVTSMHSTKNNSSLSNTQTLLISQVKDEVQKLFSLQNMRKNQQRNEANSILQMLSTTSGFNDLKKQNNGNVTEFKKQEDRKYHMKTKQRLYVQQIVNELNQNQNFIKTTKQNNLASIEFYLKKSDSKVKKKIVQKIETKYKKFFERKETHFDEDSINGEMSHITTHQQYHIQELNELPHDRAQYCTNVFPKCNKNSNNLFGNSKSSTEKYNFRLAQSLIEKQNFTTNVLSRLQPRNTTTSKIPRIPLQTKLSDTLSPAMTKKKSKLEQLFINNKNYSKEEKLVLKKKQYGIYLDEAEKQYNKIRLYRKNTAENSAM